MRKNLSQNWKQGIFYLLIVVVLIASVFVMGGQNKKEQTKYSEIVQLFQTNQVQDYQLDLSSGILQYKLFSDKKEAPYKKYTVPSVTYFLEDIGEYVKAYNQENAKKISYNYKKGAGGSIWLSMLPSAIIMIGLGVLLYIGMKRMSNSIGNETNRSLGFGKIKTKNASEESDKTFADVAGCEEEKAELEELVGFLKEPEQYTQLGAKIPKGVLMVGPPGTGKTLLAKAVAGEAGAPFLSISGSDFVEMYVGVGASRVRDLFEQAKKKAPAIVFIDEIDAVGRQRGAGLGNTNDEREQTLNQLLVEMDGFGTNTGVIVIAATNRPDVLDKALLRPGRFDRQITVNRPDTKGREEIMKVHAKDKPLAPDVDLKEVAKDTIGFTGADLANLLNEAAILAVRGGRKAIISQDIADAMSRVQLGTEKKSHKYSEKAKRLTAVHEAGHAVVSYFVEDYDPVKEVSIIPRGLGAGGYTWHTPQEENYTSRQQMLDELLVLFGGRVAEAIVLGDISTGASNDLQRATEICRDMVGRFGMTENVGPVVYNSDSGEVFLGRDYNHVNNYSEQTASRIDAEIERLMREAYEKTNAILAAHMDKLKLVTNTLLEVEKIDGVQFLSLMKDGKLPETQEETIPVEEETIEETETADEMATEQTPASFQENERETFAPIDEENNKPNEINE